MRFFRRPIVPAEPPHWLIVGLGNPGPEYRGTRHNLGFDTIDLIASRNHIRMDKGKQRELVGSGTIGNVPVMLVKPMTYMNLSGQSVAPLARAAGLKPDRVLVVADDLDLGLGTVRLKTKGSAGGHNGHKSLISSLGSQDYPRIKIGIEKVDRRETIDHVLGGFSPAEREVVDSAIEAAARAVELIVSQKMENALNYLGEFNRSRV